MVNKKAIDTIGFPEIFYDALAYVIPAAFLVFGLFFSQPQNSDIGEYFCAPASTWVIETLLVLLFFGSMFVIGQMLTVLSFYLVWLWPCKLFKTYIPFQRDYVKIKIQYPTMSLLITKRFAKCVCTRNMVLSGVILLGYYWYLGRSGMMIGVLVATVLFTIDTHVRRRWFREFIDRVKAVPANGEAHLTNA